MRVEAPIKVDKKTKRLAKRLTGGEIAVINHMDIDEVAANSLVEGKVKLVINAAPSISGKYPNKGPGILTDKNILIIDNVGQELFDHLEEGQIIVAPNCRFCSAVWSSRSRATRHWSVQLRPPLWLQCRLRSPRVRQLLHKAGVAMTTLRALCRSE